MIVIIISYGARQPTVWIHSSVISLTS
jgi:hypothetical protein